MSHNLSSDARSKPIASRAFDSGRFSLPAFSPEALEIALSIIVGLALGGVLLVARRFPSEWQGLVILAAIAPTVALLVRDLNKLMLIALVIDIPLGLDVALAKRSGEYQGGPNGFLISLMTMVLVIGYALWIARRTPDRQQRVVIPKDITIPALVFLFAMLVSMFQSRNLWYSVTEFFLYVQFFLMYLFLVNHVKDWNGVRLISTALIICLLLESLIMLAQYFTGFEMSALGVKTVTDGSDIASAEARIAGTFSGANTAGTFLATTLAIAFAATLSNNRLTNSKLAFIALLTGGAALATTLSRSALTAFGIALLIVMFQAARRRLGLKAALLFLLLSGIVLAGFSTQLVERFTDSGQRSAQARIWHAQLAFNMLDDYMFTGVGLNNTWFATAEGDYLPLEMMGRAFSRIHNKYLAIWVETGLFGLLAFVWLLVAAARRALIGLTSARDRYASVAITGLLAALFVYSWHMSSATFSGRVRPQILWLLLALIAITAELAQHRDKSNGPVLEAKPAVTESTTSLDSQSSKSAQQ